jgi:hypothetical protein
MGMRWSRHDDDRGAWGVLNGNNNIDTKRMTGSGSNRGNEQTAGMKAMRKGEGAMG